MPSPTIAERVARGSAWLDEARPGWRDQISLDRIDLYSNERCILGQVFGDPESDRCGFILGAREMHRMLSFIPGTPPADVTALGFNTESTAETAALVAEWRRVIHSGRSVALGVPSETSVHA